jgi:hypothetical protein
MECRLVNIAVADHYTFIIVAFSGPVLEIERNAIGLQLAVLTTGF